MRNNSKLLNNHLLLVFSNERAHSCLTISMPLTGSLNSKFLSFLTIFNLIFVVNGYVFFHVMVINVFGVSLFLAFNLHVIIIRVDFLISRSSLGSF